MTQWPMKLQKLDHTLLVEQRVPFLEERFGRPDEALAAGRRGGNIIYEAVRESG